MDTGGTICNNATSFPSFTTCSNTQVKPPCSTTSSSSLFSSSVTAIRKPPHCVSLKKSSLARRGYKSFEDWNSDPNHVYIGRNMTHHIAGALGSKWGNPHRINKTNKNSRKKCLKRYEDHIRRNPDLFNAVLELEGKELGCWCKPLPCHGDILRKLFKERQRTNLNSLRSDNQESTSIFNQCGRNEENDVSPSSH